MLLSIITFIVCLAGVIGFYNGLFYLTIIGGIVNWLENLLGRITGELHSLFTIILTTIIGVFLASNEYYFDFNVLCLVICYENIVMMLLGIPIYVIAYKAVKEEKKNKETKQQLDNYFSVFKM